MLNDIQIAQSAKLLHIRDVAAKLGLTEDELEFYGKYKAKISDEALERAESRPDGKLVLVTAINPTPAGEGKTTTTIGLGEALGRLGVSSCIALREPSLGPVFGIKGGAAGGGYAQVLPMEDINLHFTGDMHAITAANNLLCALIDNHIHQGNVLGINPTRVVFKRCMDMNDRALREIVVGLGGPVNGQPRQDGFMISVASEIMAILCLCSGLSDLKERLGRIVVGYRYDKTPVYCRDLRAEGAMALLLKDAIRPNLVQTCENTPAFMHGGPFANIAHGCNSVRATRLALKLADYAVTEAGFGSDLGAEKFFDIKCRAAGLKPSCVVLVATVRALKYNGGVPKTELGTENLDALRRGIVNLGAHIGNMRKYGLPVVVAVNRFPTDTDAELRTVADYCAEQGARCALSEVFVKGGEGGLELAREVLAACEEPSDFHVLYPDDLPIEQKLETVAREIYGADSVSYTAAARRQIAEIREMGGDRLPICVAKTQYSLSDDPQKLGRPTGFGITVKEARLSNGAGFIVLLTGDIMTMPGLPKNPAACSIDIDESGVITGLF